MSRFLSLLCLGFALTASAVPSFNIDLDAAPEKRWTKVASHYKTEMVAMATAVKPMLVSSAPWAWLKTVKFDPEYEGEMNGMVQAVNDPAVGLDEVKLMNMLYEMQSPTACAAVLWAAPNGTVMQGRNMDYGLHFEMPDGKVMNWPDVTFHANFIKGGKQLFQTTQWPFLVGVHTGMRNGGWSFQQNTRSAKNDWHKNFAAAQKGGELFLLVARKTMETTPKFEDAVEKMNSAQYMAPSYFILSGTGPYEGAVISADRMGESSVSTPPIQRVSQEGDGWHIVQTNDDINLAETDDARRPIANYMLGALDQKVTSTEHLMQFLHTSPLFWGSTVFSTVMVPGTNYYETTLPTEGKGIAQELFTKKSQVILAPKFAAMIEGGLKKAALVQKRSFLARRH